MPIRIGFGTRSAINVKPKLDLKKVRKPDPKEKIRTHRTGFDPL